MHTPTIGGESETLKKADTVMPIGLAACVEVTTHTPLGHCPRLIRNSSEDTITPVN
jgi:hypothetical protein